MSAGVGGDFVSVEHVTEATYGWRTLGARFEERERVEECARTHSETYTDQIYDLQLRALVFIPPLDGETNG